MQAKSPVSQQAHEMVQNGATLLDVRTPEEYAQGHVQGAVNIPVQVLPQRIAELGDPGKPVVVYCQMGGRAASATEILKRAGFQSVLNLGSINAW